jgi:hypothetical protein
LIIKNFYVKDKNYYAYNHPLIPNGQIVYDETTPLTSVVSNICFPAGTPVTTDQGTFPIEVLIPMEHTLFGRPIQSITKTYSSDKELVVFEPDSLSSGAPTHRTVMTLDHRIFYNYKLVEAFQFLTRQLSGVYLIPYNGEPVYNVFLDEHICMKVNGLMVETLDPSNPIGKAFKEQWNESNH